MNDTSKALEHYRAILKAAEESPISSEIVEYTREAIAALEKTQKVNINSFVKAQLTSRGIDILKDYQQSRLNEHKVDEQGCCKIQLWELMYIFGQHCHIGGEVFFTQNEIVLNE